MTLHIGSVGPPIRANTMEPEVFRQAIYALGQGRVGIVKSTDLAVTQNGSPNMSVNVSAGIAVIAGTLNAPVQGSYNAYNDATVNLAVAAAPGTNQRVDIVCLTIDDAFYGSSDSTPVLQIITGTPAASPTVPVAPANSLVLAHIYVGTSVTSIVTSAINSTTGTGNPDVSAAFAAYRGAGIVATATGTGSTCTSVASPGTIVNGLSVVVWPPAGRNLKLTYSVPYTGSAASLVNGIVYKDGTTILNDSWSIAPASGTVSGVCIDAPNAIAHSYTVQMWAATAQTETFTSGRGRLIVEDAGPV